MNDLAERLKLIRKNKKLRQEDLACALGSSIDRIRSLETSRLKKLNEKEISKLTCDFGISYVWLLTGAGDMFDGESPKAETNETTAEYRFFPDVYASAGNGYINVDERYEIFNLSERLADLIGSPQYTDMIKVYGDSMEPKYKSGDWLFVDRRHKKFAKEGIYVILNEGVLMVKYLQKIPKGIRVHSLNKEYADIDYLFENMQDNDLIIIGLVAGAVTFN